MHSFIFTVNAFFACVCIIIVPTSMAEPENCIFISSNDEKLIMMFKHTLYKVLLNIFFYLGELTLPQTLSTD